MSSSDEHEKEMEEGEDTPDPRIKNLDLLPQKSKEKYLVAYENFFAWKSKNNMHSFREEIFLAYFQEMAQKYKPTSLWCMYSMLKTTLMSKNKINISKYSRLLSLLKNLSAGFTSFKCKVLTGDDVEKFLNEAPDEKYLATKVALIFGITGACTRQELLNITPEDVRDYGDLIHVKIHRKNKPPRSFVIEDQNYETVKKYQAVRVDTDKNNRFFQNYQNGKCTCQPIGINKLGAMPRQIAKYLGLPDSNSYTGHSFKRTSATLMVNTIKRLRLTNQGERNHDKNNEETENATVPQNNDEDPLKNSNNTETLTDPAKNLKTTIKVELTDDDESANNAFEREPSPSTSMDEPLSFLNNECAGPKIRSPPRTSFEFEVNEDKDNVSSVLDQILKMPSKRITLHFNNCTFNNSFNSK